MPPAGKRYTLRGFSAELDLRPLRFVEPLPPAMVCSACGLVPKVIAFLPCGHFLCEPCYGRVGRVCPLDNDSCRLEDVVWRHLSVEKIVARQVSCWNAANGCDVVSEVSAMTRHFRDDCPFHAVSCCRCSALVLCTELVQHLGSGCSSLTLPEGASAGVGERSQATLSDNIENIALEVKAALRQITTVSTLTESRLKQISVTNESVETSAREVLRRGDVFEAGMRELTGKQERAFDVLINMLEDTLSVVRQIDDATQDNAGHISRLGKTLGTFVATQNTAPRERTERPLNVGKTDRGGSSKKPQQSNQDIEGSSKKPQQSNQDIEGSQHEQEETLRCRRTSPGEGASENMHSVTDTRGSNSNSASRCADPVISIALDGLFRFIGNTVLHAASLTLMLVAGVLAFVFGWISLREALTLFLPTSYAPVFNLIMTGYAILSVMVAVRTGWRWCLVVVRILREQLQVPLVQI